MKRTYHREIRLDIRQLHTRDLAALWAQCLIVLGKTTHTNTTLKETQNTGPDTKIEFAEPDDLARWRGPANRIRIESCYAQAETGDTIYISAPANTTMHEVALAWPNTLSIDLKATSETVINERIRTITKWAHTHLPIDQRGKQLRLGLASLGPSAAGACTWLAGHGLAATAMSALGAGVALLGAACIVGLVPAIRQRTVELRLTTEPDTVKLKIMRFD